MWVVHHRMAELWFINKTREIAKLKNLSFIASMTNDMYWQHELCSKKEKIEG
ncbi:DUF7667 family protein [Brevibacillus laterosporus]|uniref:DUF7667 family protein n=1 Tax=Brevibacillus laterosporus TaxID=1465 RepID=UPI001EF2D9A5|nr:hypothetical protein [Brevibacillus laterosporus]MCG7316393.1 hypothetical protein [Brevibacillus laterosporus]